MSCIPDQPYGIKIKSTTNQNLTTALYTFEKKIMQIGCDPKANFVKMLMNGRRQPSVLDSLRKEDEVQLEDVLKTCFGGISCVKSGGGPELGVSCATHAGTSQGSISAISPKRISQLIAKQIPVVQPPYESQQSQDHRGIMNPSCKIPIAILPGPSTKCRACRSKYGSDQGDCQHS
jgi:hypothetical protein